MSTDSKVDPQGSTLRSGDTGTTVAWSAGGEQRTAPLRFVHRDAAARPQPTDFPAFVLQQTPLQAPTRLPSRIAARPRTSPSRQAA